MPSSIFKKMLSEKDREDKPPRRTKREKFLDEKIKAELDKIPEEERLQALEDAVQELRKSFKKFEKCPKCGKDLFESQFYRGRRNCRNCSYQEIDEDQIKVLKFVESSRESLTIGDISKSLSMRPEAVFYSLKALGYGVA